MKRKSIEEETDQDVDEENETELSQLFSEEDEVQKIIH